jgi:delta24(24(1))-sterol reductase
MASNMRNRSPPAIEDASTPLLTKTSSKNNPKYTDGESDEFEFGGSLGAASLMVAFPLLMWYMWVGATYYDGHFPTPESDQSRKDFIYRLARLVYEGAYPTAKAWAIYWIFFIFEAVMFVRSPSWSKKVHITDIDQVLLHARCDDPRAPPPTRRRQEATVLLLCVY